MFVRSEKLLCGSGAYTEIYDAQENNYKNINTAVILLH